MSERHRDRVLAELPGDTDRTAALEREPVVFDPDPDLVRRASVVLRPDDPAELAGRRLDPEHAVLREALLAALERLASHDHRDRLAMQDVRDPCGHERLCPPTRSCITGRVAYAIIG